jgi:hypothetical protein
MLNGIKDGQATIEGAQGVATSDQRLKVRESSEATHPCRHTWSVSFRACYPSARPEFASISGPSACFDDPAPRRSAWNGCNCTHRRLSTGRFDTSARTSGAYLRVRSYGRRSLTTGRSAAADLHDRPDVVGGAAPASHGFKECQCDCAGEVARLHDRAARPEVD